MSIKSLEKLLIPLQYRCIGQSTVHSASFDRDTALLMSHPLHHCDYGPVFSGTLAVESKLPRNYRW